MAVAKTTGVWVGRSRRFWVLSLAALVLGSWAPTAKAQTCDQTLSVGANVASAVSGAANGSTVCLNSGDYGAVTLAGIDRSGFVTVQPVTGATVTMHAIVNDSSFIRLKGLRHAGSQILDNATHHVELVDCTFVPNGEGLAINGLNDSPPATPQEIVIDGCDFTNVSIALWDGRINVRGMNGVKIRNSLIAGSSNPGQKADGIMLIGGSRNTEVGPGNTFRDILQAGAQQGEHVDSIQIYGAGSGNRIFGNYFHDSDVFAGAFDGVSDLTIENNVFDGRASDSVFKITMQAASNITFRHNTSYDSNFRIDNKSGDPVSSNVLVENNVFLGDGGIAQTGGCNNCTYRYNLFDAGGSTGTDNVIGTPTFVGGASPTTYAGWALASGSLGENAGNDGLDMGIVLDGDPPPPPPPPVTIETPVNVGTGSSKVGNSVSITTTAAVPAGATVFVVLGEAGDPIDDEPRPTAKDSINGIYTLDLYAQAGVGGNNLAVFRLSNSASLPVGTTITVKVCATDLAKAVSAFYVSSTSPLVLDKSASLGATTATSLAVTPSITTTTADQFLLGAVSIPRHDRVVTQDPEFLSTVSSSETNTFPGQNREVVVGDRIITSVESNNYGVTFDQDVYWVIGLLSYKLQ